MSQNLDSIAILLQKDTKNVLDISMLNYLKTETTLKKKKKKKKKKVHRCINLFSLKDNVKITVIIFYIFLYYFLFFSAEWHPLL